MSKITDCLTWEPLGGARLPPSPNFPNPLPSQKSPRLKKLIRARQEPRPTSLFGDLTSGLGPPANFHSSDNSYTEGPTVIRRL